MSPSPKMDGLYCLNCKADYRFVPNQWTCSMDKKLSMWKHRKWRVESTNYYVMGVFHTQSWCKTLQFHKFVTLHACVRNLDDEIYIAHYISIWCITGCFQIELRSFTGSVVILLLIDSILKCVAFKGLTHCCPVTAIQHWLQVMACHLTAPSHYLNQC